MIIASLYPCPFDPQDRHDLNASIIKGGDVYAYEEAKLTSVKLEPTEKFPERSLMMGFRELGVLPSEVDAWVFPTPSQKVDLKDQYLFFSTMFKAYLGTWEDFGTWFKDHVHFVPHQLSHAALAVFGSGFEECAFLCQDGGGDFGDERDFVFGEFQEQQFQISKSHYGVNTICSFHAFVTDSLGFSDGDNGKTSGLAAYGEVQPSLTEAWRPLLSIKEDGIDFHRERYQRTPVDLSKVDASAYQRGKVVNRFPSDTNILQSGLEFLPQDIAATGESLVQVSFLNLLELVSARTSLKKIALCGGLFQNVALNNKILESGIFEDIYIPMAASDAGLALGAAWYVQHELKVPKKMGIAQAFLGPSYGDTEIQALLDRFRLNYSKEEDIAKKAAELISQGMVVGWFQGKAEYGPRSLGSRSILADPRDPRSKLRINQLLKKRDWFMPYAPSILEEFCHEWVDYEHPATYMQIAFKIREDKKHLIPAAVHVDDSSRVHVLRRADNELYWSLINHFREITGLPVVLNTSFNRHGIATISTPRQAVEHLLEGCMDYLAIEGYLVSFSENRLVSEIMPKEIAERVCLQEDCIRRLKTVIEHGDEGQISNFVERLSGFIETPLTFNQGELSIDGEVALSIDSGIDTLLGKIHTVTLTT